MPDGLTVVFFPEGAFGPTNNCVGIAEVLQARGHRAVFVIEESFAGNLETQGFEERLMRLTPAPTEPEVPGQFWKDFIRDTAPIFRRATIEALEGFVLPTWQALCDGARHADDRLLEIFDEVGPDVIVQDNVVAFPAIHACGRPWVRIVSCNPTELRDADVPPTFSGYPVADRSQWKDFAEEYERTHSAVWSDFNEFGLSRGAAALEHLEFMHVSEWCNLYLFPAEADYARAVPLAPTFHRLDSCVRSSRSSFEIPDVLRAESRPGSRLVYLSLGSLGSADVALMQRLVDVLGATEHRVIVSKGPQADLIELRPNMWGEEFVPQPAILPLVDIVITHGGNNTTTECFHHGKPMVVLPLFWDQHANAQRVDELGFGRRLPTYAFEAADMTKAIDTLTADKGLARRMATMSARLKATPGTVTAAEFIETVGRTAAPVT
ncbi:MAG: nucleotide disphospho-sugar-binding domain-containing protein [Acidimicrobiales bacterium]